VRGEQLRERVPDLVAERHERGQVMEAQVGGAVVRQEAPVEVDLAADRLDQLEDHPAATAHGHAHVPRRGLVALEEGRARRRHLGRVLDAEALGEQLEPTVDVPCHPADLPDVGEQVAEGGDRAWIGEDVVAHRRHRTPS
jgi:hypothetical protein